MVRRYGQDRIDELKQIKYQPLKITRQDYEEMEQEYKRKIAELDEIQK